MSSMFSRTKDNTSYMFKDGKNLSKKQRKKKRRGWATVIGVLLVLIEIALAGLLVYEVLQLNILPDEYLIAFIAILAVLSLYNLISQFSRAHILGKVLAVIMSCAIVFVYLFASKFGDVLNKVSTPTVNTDIVDVCVLATDKADVITDCANYKFGYNSAVSNSNVTAAFEDIKKDMGVYPEQVKYESWSTIIDALYANKDIQAVVINDSMLSVISQEFTDFTDKIKIIQTYKYTTQVENTSKSNVNVRKDPFIIYVSGISSDAGADTKLSSYALSDVNILAVINPQTRQVLLVTTPRDSYIKISDNNGNTGYDKLTHAGNYGIERSIEALENLYGIDVDYYVKINFSGCIDVVDALGGITINSEVEFTNGDEAAPVAYHFVVGENECDGAKTVAFARERKAFLSGDFQRGRNQAAAISAIIDKATSPAILTKYSAIMDAVSNSFLTNMPNSAISELVKSQLSDSTAWNVQTYSIGGTTGTRTLQVTGLHNASIVMPDYNDINTAIKLINKTENDEVFNVDEYVESLEAASTTSTTTSSSGN